LFRVLSVISSLGTTIQNNFELRSIAEVCLDVCNALCCSIVVKSWDRLALPLADFPFPFPFPQISPHLIPSQTPASSFHQLKAESSNAHHPP
jgi:hypothetical protein